MTGSEYGRIVNALAPALYDMIESELGVIAAAEVDLLVQMGGPWSTDHEPNGFVSSINRDSDPELLAEFGLTDRDFQANGNIRWLSRMEVENSLILRELSPEAREAIGGLVEHYYFGNNSGDLNYTSSTLNYINTDIGQWAAAGLDDLPIYITEWNISTHSIDQLGLRAAGALLVQFEYMIRMSVDAAFVWPVQHNTRTDLFGMYGEDVDFSAAGYVFEHLATNTVGLSLIDMNVLSSSYEMVAFEGEGQLVIYVASRTSGSSDVEIDISDFATHGLDWHTVSVEIVGVDYTTSNGSHLIGGTPVSVEPFGEHDASGSLEILDVRDFEMDDEFIFHLDPFEVAMIVIEYSDPSTGSGQSLPATQPPTPGTNNTLLYLAGQTVYDGGAGFDRVDFSAGPQGLTINLEDGRLNGGLASGVSFIGIEGLIGTRFDDVLTGTEWNELLSGGAGIDRLTGGGGNDTLVGGDGTDFLRGGLGNDRLEGGNGSDWIVPGAGNDVVFGGAGSDTVAYGTSTRGVDVNLTTGRATDGGGMSDTLFEVENIAGSRFADTLMGDNGANRLRGFNGQDVMIATAGNDTYDGGGSTDSVTYASATSGVEVNLTTGRGTAGLATGHTFIDIETIIGTPFSDTLTGSSGRDFLSGRDGDDFIFATRGNDIYYGGFGDDTVDYSGSNGGVRIFLNLKTAEGAIADGHLLFSIENVIGSRFDDRISGTAADNDLYGGNGNDTILGYEGNDRLEGGRGADVLFGHGGNDRFVGGAGDDRIFGGAGRDTAVFSGDRSEYQVTRISNSELSVTHVGGDGSDGMDRLFSIEQLQFGDGTIIV